LLISIAIFIFIGIDLREFLVKSVVLMALQLQGSLLLLTPADQLSFLGIPYTYLGNPDN
jgi:hypothetical protein